MQTPLFGVLTNLNTLEASRPYIDGVELRLDCFEHIDPAALRSFLRTCGLPVMLTLRRTDRRTEEERLEQIAALCQLGPAYVDLEWDVPENYRKNLFETYPHIQFLSSYHDFSGMPDLEEIYSKIKTPYAHIYKMALMAQSSIDALRLLHFVHSRSHQENIIGIAMGKAGAPTRILAPIVGSFLTYAALETPTAPGQLTARELQETYRFRKLSRATDVYALIGNPVDASLGAIFHNAAFEGSAVYVKIALEREELPAFLSLTSKLPFKGFSVTMPLKEAILPLIRHELQAIGACNTVKLVDGQWVGYNTDGIGALTALEQEQPVLGKHIVIVGAGGAAKAIAFEALQRGAQVTILNRTASKAIAIAKALRCRGGGWDLFPEVCAAGYDSIINCIPDGDLIEEEWILPEKIAMDIIYVPQNTPFLIKASRKQCRLVFGYAMFSAQALEQQKIWLGGDLHVPRHFEFDPSSAQLLLSSRSADR